MARSSSPAARRSRCERVVADDGAVLHVEVDPVPGAPTVVLCHGLAARSSVWADQRALLRGRAESLVWDQRGHGASGHGVPGRTTVGQTGRDLASVLELTRPGDPVVLVGHSLGGMSILSLAEQRPDLIRSRVDGVLLLATSAGRLARDGLLGQAVGTLDRLGLLPTLLGALAAAGPLLGPALPPDGAVLRWLTRRFLIGPHAPPEVLATALAAATSHPYSAVTSFLPSLLAYDGTPGLAVLADVPTTVVAAAADRVIPPQHSRCLRRSIGDRATLIEVAAGHGLTATSGDVIAAALGDLLAGVTGRAAATAA